MKNLVNRREFLKISALSATTLFISSALTGCGGSNETSDYIQVGFDHGVASGDPLNDRVIIWTRATPKESVSDSATFPIDYEISTDAEFSQILRKGVVSTFKESDYTIKIDLQDLEADTVYYYRFLSGGTISDIGKIKTLATGDIAQVKMAVFSCANYTNGYFNAYMEASKIEDLDVAIHLGDYIYEYGMYDEDDGVTPAYATQNAQAIGRVLPSDNDKECIALEDYRRRYALYHTDEGSKAIHAACPMIVVWDDHETANDAYIDGAANHQEDEGSWDDRVAAALQAYFEWLPIRPIENKKEIYRSFDFGNLVSLHMLETRLNSRTKELSYAKYFDAQGAFDGASFVGDVSSTDQVLLGETQLSWLKDKLAGSSATWQVLGQQILMGKMHLPAEFLAPIGQLDYAKTQEEYDALIGQINTLMAELVALKMKNLQGETLTAQEELRLQTKLPYNLDAWDGYAYEREVIFDTVRALDKNLVVLSGDTHNGWRNNLVDKNGNRVGVEFATASVSSPGFEEYVALDSLEKAMNFEGALQLLIDDLGYLNASDRGFMLITFKKDTVTSKWIYLQDTKSTNYTINNAREEEISIGRSLDY